MPGIDLCFLRRMGDLLGVIALHEPRVLCRGQGVGFSVSISIHSGRSFQIRLELGGLR